MKMFIVSLLDLKLGEYAPPVCVPSLGVAERSLQTSVNKGEGDVGQYPEDFQLFHVGNFDTEQGTVEFMTPHLICHASALKS